MSGGSLDYAFARLNDAISTIQSKARRPLHVAFAQHLTLVSKALHDLEWEWSGDYGDRDADEAIRGALLDGTPLVEGAKVDGSALVEGAKLAQATIREMQRELADSLALLDKATVKDEDHTDEFLASCAVCEDDQSFFLILEDYPARVDLRALDRSTETENDVYGSLGVKQASEVHLWLGRWLERRNAKASTEKERVADDRNS